MLRLARPIGQQTIFRVGGDRIVEKSVDPDRIPRVREVYQKHLKCVLNEDCGPGSQSRVGGYKALIEENQNYE